MQSFSAFTNIQPGGGPTLIIVTFEWISSHQVTLESTFCLWWPLPSVSVFDTFSSIYSDLRVQFVTVWIRAGPVFACNSRWLVYSRLNTRWVELPPVRRSYIRYWNIYWRICNLHPYGTKQTSTQTKDYTQTPGRRSVINKRSHENHDWGGGGSHRESRGRCAALPCKHSEVRVQWPCH